MVESLSEAQIEEFRATFAYFDKHDRGHISRDELGCMMRMLGTCPKEDDLQSMLNDLDTEGNGQITFDQFLNTIARKMRESETKEELIELFRMFDDDGNGSISVDELRDVMNGLVDRLTYYEVEGMVQQADKEGKGEISFHDFIKLITEIKR